MYCNATPSQVIPVKVVTLGQLGGSTELISVTVRKGKLKFEIPREEHNFPINNKSLTNN